LKVNTNLPNGAKVLALIPLELIDVYPISEKENLIYDNLIEAKLLECKLIGEFYEMKLEAFGKIIEGRELIGKEIPTAENMRVVIGTDRDDFRIFPLMDEETEKSNKKDLIN
ncbi:MAG: hypothetical protein ACTSPI_12765, partial [Candidatus Heimdallarchaeaceae archaeon]